MSLIIVPDATSSVDMNEAQRKFQAAIDDNYTVVVIVYGEGKAIDEVLEVACARAAANAPIRRVLWVRNAAVLTQQQRDAYSASNFPAIFVGLDDKVAAKLPLDKAKVRLYVDEAFSNAGG